MAVPVQRYDPNAKIRCQMPYRKCHIANAVAKMPNANANAKCQSRFPGFAAFPTQSFFCLLLPLVPFQNQNVGDLTTHYNNSIVFRTMKYRYQNSLCCLTRNWPKLLSSKDLNLGELTDEHQARTDRYCTSELL